MRSDDFSFGVAEVAAGYRSGLKMTVWTASAGPWALVVTMISHAAHVFLVLGRWPVVYRDVVSSSWLSLHETFLLTPAVFWAALAVPSWIVFGSAARSAGLLQRHQLLVQLAVLASGYLALVLCVLFDPTGYVAWHMD